MTTRLRNLHGLQFTAVMLLIAAAPLWGLLIAQMLWVAVPERCLYVVNPAAITIPIVAAIFWVGGHNSRKSRDISQTHAENHGVALDTLWNLTRHASGRLTGPLKRVK